MTLEEYSNLPEAIEQVEIERMFLNLIDESKSMDKALVLDCMWELALRQSNNYSPLSESVSKQLTDFLSKSIDPSSAPIIETILSIVINLGLQSTYEDILKLLYEPCIKSDVKEAIKESYSEFGTSIVNIS